MTGRDDFKVGIKRKLAERVGYFCSKPSCRAATSGPHSNPDKSIIVGIAAHITAASPGGPRYDASLTEKQRKSSENGIWLCARCATLVDRDEVTFTAEQLREWKRQAENDQFIKISAGLPQTDLGADENEKLLLLTTLMERSGAGFHSVLRPGRFEAVRGTAGFRIFLVRRNRNINIFDLIGGISRNRISMVRERTGEVQLVVLDSQGNRSMTTYTPKRSKIAEYVCLTWEGNNVSLWWAGSKVSQLTLPNKLNGQWLALTSGLDIDGENSASYIIKGVRGGGGIGFGLCAADKSLQLIMSYLLIKGGVLPEEEIRTMATVSAADALSNL